MCGICGIYQTKKIDEAELKETVKKMNASQKNRGPDDEGILIDSFSVYPRRYPRQSASIAVGHRRLSIIDLSKAGYQPMGYQSQKSKVKSQKFNLWITYNGEIYNFFELKKELEKKGYKFKTKTDTEVILALYAEYGEKSFSMLRGMFAFGLWDEKNKKLFLVKDRYGIKPLYYYADNEKLIFSSTVKALEKSGLFRVEKNPQAMIGFLLFGSVPLPLTTVKNVFAIPSGHYLVREADGRQKMVQYYSSLDFFNIRRSNALDRSNFLRNLRKLSFHNNFHNIINEVRQRLKESVNLHLISDAPLGVFLSGGLDSSVIAALAAYNMGKSDLPNIDGNVRRSDFQKLTTLSIIFDEPEFSEEYYSDLVAQKISSDHCKIKITKKDFEESFDEIFEAMDQPTIDGVNTFFIAKAAKQVGLKTVLSGLGGDEIFLGYPHFQRAELLRKIQKLISIFGRRTSIGRPTSLILNLLGDRYSKLSYFVNSDILSFYLGIRGLFAPQEAAKILDIDEKEVNDFIINMGRFDLPRGSTSQILTANSQEVEPHQIDPINLLSYLELKFYLQNQLLKDTDFMSMYHSIEVRVPFLDHPLVEYLSSLPPEIKLNIRTSDVLRTSDVQKLNKPLLVESVRDLLPQEIFTRSKMGFTFPFQKWFQESKKQSALGDSRFTKIHWSRFWANLVLKNWKL